MVWGGLGQLGAGELAGTCRGGGADLESDPKCGGLQLILRSDRIGSVPVPSEAFVNMWSFSTGFPSRI